MKLKFTIIFILSLATANSLLQASDTLYDSRFKRWQEKAKKGEAFSQYSLGNAYLRGNEVDIDTNKAIFWFKEAAKQGHAKSEYKLGYLYYSGKGIKRNYTQAFEWFSKAAERNYSPAQFYLGRLLAEGKGADRDYDQAIAWLEKARKNDYSPAAAEISRIKARMQKNQSSPVKVVSKPPIAPAAKVVKKKRTKTAKKKGVFDTLDLLQQSGWIFNNEPSEILPSDINTCSNQSGTLKCLTRELQKNNLFVEISYKVETVLSRFNNKGRFLVITRTNNMFVLPTDPDDPDVDPETIPATGWTQTRTLKCRFINENKIRCSTDDFKKISFSHP